MRSTEAVAARHRFAMTDEPSSPTPTRRYTADLFLSLSVSIASGFTRGGLSVAQALTARWLSRLSGRISVVIGLDKAIWGWGHPETASVSKRRELQLTARRDAAS